LSGVRLADPDEPTRLTARSIRGAGTPALPLTNAGRRAAAPQERVAAERAAEYASDTGR